MFKIIVLYQYLFYNLGTTSQYKYYIISSSALDFNILQNDFLIDRGLYGTVLRN